MQLSDDLLKHKIFVQRMTKKQASYMLKYLEQALSVARAYTGDNFKQLKEILADIIKTGINPSINALNKLSQYEIQFVTKLFKKYGRDLKNIGVIDAANLKLAMVTGGTQYTIADSYNMYADRKADELVQTIKDNQSLGKKAVFVALGLITAGLMYTQLRSLSSSVINKTVIETHKEQFRSNGIYFVRWLNTLDPQVNTCPYCERRDGLQFPIDDPSIQGFPPHVNCQCDLEPVFFADRV